MDTVGRYFTITMKEKKSKPDDKRVFIKKIRVTKQSLILQTVHII